MRQAADPTRSAPLVAGAGELIVGTGPDDVLVAQALGSGVAVCLFDPVSLAGGLLHFLLPEARINPVRAQAQPTAFADSGIPLLLQAAGERGLDRTRCRAWLVGGTDAPRSDLPEGVPSGLPGVGRRNALAARNVLWRAGVLVTATALGGATARTVTLSLGTGRLLVAAGRDPVEVL